VRYAHVGLRVDDEWFCSAACVTVVAASRLRNARPRQVGPLPVPPPRLGTLLVHQGTITPTQRDNALEAQRLSGRRLGAELQHLGYASATDVLRGLAAQAGVSYLGSVDPESVNHGPGGLCASEVRALGVVPIRAVEASRVLVVACSAPLPRAALGALGSLTPWTPIPYLVTDEDLNALLEAYGSAPPAEEPVVRAASVATVDAAARRIADAAFADRTITVAEARLDPFTWIRVEGKHGVDAMLLSHTTEHQEEPWPVGTTQH
jgi:hypothetical protein